jgi:hypothetical protein
MPAKPRSKIFDPDVVGAYHCYNRLVQRRHLFGWDLVTNKDFSYRKDWVRNRFRELAGAMAIDVLDYAILDNHLHVVLRNRPDIVERWSDEEVARRWWYVCPDRRNEDGSAAEPKPCEIGLYRQNADEYRKRLSDISWMMRLACQPIARRANREDNMDGRFFAKRFDCQRLQSLADVLACSIYVDLNWVAAGMAQTPEESRYTSAFERIRARWTQVQSELGTQVGLPAEQDLDHWLAPIFLDERAESYAAGGSATELEPGESASKNESRSSTCNPIGSARISNMGFLPMTCEQYLTLLDLLGRVVRRGKRGVIPPELPPILERLGVAPLGWIDSLLALFGIEPPDVRPTLVTASAAG